MGGSTSSSILNNQITTKVVNENSFKTKIQTVQQKIATAMISSAVSVSSTGQNTFDFDATGFSSQKDIEIDLTINQTTKVVNFSSITTQFVNNITSELATDTIDSLVSSLNSDSVLALQNTAGTSQKDGLLDSLTNILKSSPSNSMITNIVNSSTRNSYHVARDNLISNIVSSSTTMNLATDIRLTALNSASAKLKDLTTTGNIKVKMTSNQISDLYSQLVQDTRIIQNLVDKLTSSNQFKFDSNVKNLIDVAAKSSATTSKEGEQVSQVIDSSGSAIGKVIGGVALFPIIIIGGIILILGIFIVMFRKK